MIQRLFVVEPGLSGAGGHPIQYALSLMEFAATSDIPVFVVGPRTIDHSVTNSLRDPIPILRDHCFPISVEASSNFYHALVTLHNRFKFDNSDLILITSAHINEIRGLDMFIAEFAQDVDCPRIAANFHQLYPPALDIVIGSSKEYQSIWAESLRAAFSDRLRRHPRVSFWTAPSKALQEELSALARCTVGQLPFLFSTSAAKRKSRQIGASPRFGFLGDGRAEKGLLILLNAILRWFPGDSDITFVIQNIRPRGYDANSRTSLASDLDDARRRSNVQFVETALDPRLFSDLLTDLDGLVLPYDPRHYHNRGSLLFVQSAAVGVPSVVSDGTSMATQIKADKACGTIFTYEETNQMGNSERLAEAIWEFSTMVAALSECAVDRSQAMRENHNAERYVATIIKHYE